MDAPLVFESIGYFHTADPAVRRAAATVKKESPKVIPMLKVRCNNCGTKYSGTYEQIQSLKVCNRCGSSPFAFSIVDSPPEMPPPDFVQPPPIAQPATSFFSAVRGQKNRASPLRQAFQTEAATVHKPIQTIALIFFILGLVWLGLAAILYLRAGGSMIFEGHGGLGFIVVLCAVVFLILGFLILYLTYLLYKAIALGLKYLSVMADRSGR